MGGGAELAYARDLPLMQLGLDSVGLLELAEALALRCGVALPATFLFQHNTPARIVAYFDASRHAPPRAGCDTGCEPAGAAAAAARPSSRGCPATEPGAAREPAQAAPFAPDGIAIVGIACRLPGGLDTPEAFWDALKAGACVVGELPGDRWTWPADIDPGARHRGIDRGGFLDDIRSFDAGLFRLSPKEVATMDPQQRILLELAWEAIERAGHCADAVAGSRTGVYVGASGSDYRLLLERAGTGVDAHVATGASMAVIANRISYTYDLRGPSIQVDTACSSSLVALHQAVQALRAGECDQALVGGVNVICHPGNTIAYYKAGMLSPQGRCKTLDDAADGYVRSEGAVMLMLRRLEQAVADGDPIHAVIRGSACNHGGLTGGLTVPHPDRQADLLRAAWAAARVSADDIGYLEMHGTGTRLGDPIEVRGLADAFGARDDAAARGTCGIGSVKSNLGHLEAAAGLAGVLKTVLALKHREVPATIHFSRLNAQISLARTPFAVVDTHRAWPARGGARRLAGVSSFGSGGANAHVVLEEYPSEAPPRAAAGDALFVLSAHSREQLAEYARRVLAYCERRLQSGDDAPAAAAVAHALQRRQAMAWRLAFVAASLEEAVRRLRAFAAGAAQPGTFVGGGAPKTSVADFVNQNPDVQQVVSAWLRERQLAKLARYWADGVRIANWSALYDARPACVPLPCYPFARERHWIAARPAEASEATAAAAPPAAPDDAYRAAPRLEAESRDAAGASFRVRLDGDASFLTDHRLRGRKILPGVVHFELAHAAWAALARADAPAIEFRDLAWTHPVDVATPERVLGVRLRRVAARPGAHAYEAYSPPDAAGGGERVHARGTVLDVAGPPEPALDLDALRARFDGEPGAHERDAHDCHRAFERMGFGYGPAHRGLRGLRWRGGARGATEVLAHIVLPDCIADARERHRLPPGLLDAAVQAAMAAAIGRDALGASPACVPFSLDRLVCAGSCPARAWVWARRRDGARAALAPVDLDVCDDRGRVWASFRALTFRPLREAAGRDVAAPRLFRPRWAARPLSGERASAGAADVAHWLVLCGFDEGAALRRDLATLRARLPDTSIVAIDSDAATLESRFADSAGQLFELFRELALSGATPRAAVQVLVPADGPERAFAALSALVRGARLEHPSWSVQLLSLERATQAADAAARALENRGDDADFVRYRRARRESLVFEALPAGRDEPPRPWKEAGVYLITGGAGGLGLAFAKDIAAHVRRATIVLAGRAAAPDAALSASLGAIARPAGVDIRYRSVDVGDAPAVAALVGDLLREHGRLSGVIHAAGVTRDALLVRKPRAEFDAVLRPKVAGAAALYAATQDIDLDFLVSFSSIVGVTGNLGQTDYGAANAFLDALAGLRAQMGGERRARVLSIAWPLWRDGGMGRESEVAAHFERAFALAPMDTAAGIDAFHRALVSDAAYVVVANGDADWTPERAIARALSTRARPGAPEPAERAHGPAREAAAAACEAVAVSASSLSPSSSSASASASVSAECAPTDDGAARRHAVVAYLTRQIGAVLGHAPDSLDIDAPFTSYGMDSILALDTTRAIETDLGSLSKTLFFEHENVRQLSDYLLDEHADRLAACAWFAQAGEPARAAGPALAAGGEPTRETAEPSAAADTTADTTVGIAIETSTETPTAATTQAGAAPEGRYRRVAKAALPADGQLAAAVAAIGGAAATKGVALFEIWPELFVDSAGHGYCHLLVDGGVLFAAQHAGDARHRAALFAALLAYCDRHGYAFGYLDLSEGRKPDLEAQCGLLAAPVGVVQIVEAIASFSLAGGRMRRLRYMVERFRKAGACRVVEYRAPDPDVAREIRRVICAWSDAKKVVNNVDIVLGEMASGSLHERYRVFLTYLDDVLQNVIMIARDGDGYLMDQEYYVADMPLGGTEYAVTEILAALAAEGRERFSLGLTWGLFDTGEGSSDPAADAFLASTQTQLRRIFERGAANRQYKSKYGTRDHAVYLYRRPGKPEPAIVGCLSQFYRKGLTHHEVRRLAGLADAPAPAPVSVPVAAPATVPQVTPAPAPVATPTADERAYDVTRIDAATIRVDLVSDSWAHVDYPFMRARAATLDRHAPPARGGDPGRAVAALLGFAQCLLTTSGRAAEHLFFRARRSARTRVPQNLLFESTLHNLVKSGFEPVELPDARALDPDSRDLFRGGVDLAALDRELQAHADATAMVMLELCNNASGGYPVALAQIRAIAAACRRHGVPLVMDVTRIVKNAELIRRGEAGYAQRGLWEIVREIADHADAIVGSLCKDFGLGAGGLLAARDARVVANAAGIARLEGGLPGPAELRRIAAAFDDRAYLEREIGRQLDFARDLHIELERCAVPVVQPGAGHCVLVRVDQLAPPGGSAPSRGAYLRLLAERYGVRGGLHLVGNLRDSHLNACVRLALPLGFDDPRGPGALAAALAAARDGRDHALDDLMRAPRARAAHGGRCADGIAIIGLSGRYPDAPTLDAFWRNLVSGRRSISEIPAERWDWRDHYERDPDTAVAHGKSYGKWGGFLDGFSAFDPLFFQIAPREAEFIDPQERLFLEACWHALEDAGCPPSALTRAQRAKAGVFGGMTKQGFNLYGAGGAQPYQSTSLAALVNRVSHCFDFNGPAVAFDSHCASALVAIHEACQYLRREPEGIAIAGAVNLNLHPSNYQQLSKMQVLASGAESASFASGGLGYVPGEGVGAVVLKDYRRALEDGDPIYGVIRGSAVNQNGRMNRFGMPSQKQQEAVVRAALAQAGVDPRSITYVEASAHGSAVGDAIEMAALTRVFGARERADGRYRIGSVKPNIGHGEAVSGMSQLTKVLLSLRHGQLPPTLVCGAPNPDIDFDALPFELNTSLTDWARARVDSERVPRRAGITSTGASGLNAHLVLEEHAAPAVPAQAGPGEADARAHVFVLSARDRARLDDYARDWIAFLNDDPQRDLAAIAYTLQVGREPMACRLAVVAADCRDLAGKLARWREAAHADCDDVFHGEARAAAGEPHREAARDAREPRDVARAWVGGAVVDWAARHAGARPARVAGLPGYPFERRSYWPGAAAAPATARAAAASDASEAARALEAREAHEATRATRMTRAARESEARQAPEAPSMSEVTEATEATEVAEARDARPGAVADDAAARLEAAFLPRFIELVADVFRLPAGELDADRPLDEYGINSFLIKVLNVRFADIVGRVSSTLPFEYRTAGEMARHFLTAHRDACAAWVAFDGAASPGAADASSAPPVPAASASAASATPATPATQATQATGPTGEPSRASAGVPSGASSSIKRPGATWDEPIAIVGVSGRYPQARDLDAFWDNLMRGRDSITEIPPERWPLDGFYDEDRERAIGASRSYAKWGGFIDGFAEFDPQFFNLSPREASNMDPQERIFLQACWEALEDAAYTRARIAREHGGRLGVFAGITRAEFCLYGAGNLKQGKAPFTSFCSLVNRVSYFLDANGPSIPIDTMCSSSLVAVHEACDKLRLGECEVALAGGVNLSLHPYMYVSLSAQRMLSSDGRCKSFGLGGNGYVPGEGVGVIVLKPLSRALADGDRIHATIRATSINHGGKTNGYTVPNPIAQQNVIRSALDRAGVHARAVSYVEAHGTGTELGDPIEIAGLSGAFRRDTSDRGFCAIGSVKSNIGHLEAASGLAGLTKVLLQMKHGLLVPSLHASELNPNIDFPASPFVVNRETRAWERPVIDGREHPRIAGVSSFGAGGTNAHVILEEPPRQASPARAPTPAGAPALIVLSAKKPEQLRRYASELLARLRDADYRARVDADGLRSLAYTLQVGREAMDERLAVIADSVQALEGKLRQFVDGKTDIQDLHVSRVGRSAHHVI
ncbi:polyketide synthase, type I [Burkholderia pseudomallei]|nr:polyketide synthase, type I [Burkholderia pseudomallei]